ncbi:MAG: bifunctional DNA-formamidopyrimidine glycosylase/DNA-(apurinic or apyrimidinic site) lyase [Desulfobacteraceae bacterium]|nr:bifunctional DNA-formamidopyrimidine glycosylase/DNA-(apurinic or apyrimidinic site) lyase [Desulfobacteraceae bacterium]
MPELPEVQTIVDDLLAAGLPGAAVTAVAVYWPRSVAGLNVCEFTERLSGRRISGIRRRGKFIVFDLAPDLHLLVHLRMSGRLLLMAGGGELSPHQHVIIALDDGRELRFHDPRKFGRMYLVAKAGERLGRLGPEPLARGFTARRLAEGLGGRKRSLKPLLLDQSFIAGLGNIYVDEALWDARLHPCRRSDSLAADEVVALHRAIRKVLRRGLRNNGTSLGAGQSNFNSIGEKPGSNREALRVFRRTGLACPRCRSPIARIIVGQRSTHICPRCQTAP